MCSGRALLSTVVFTFVLAFIVLPESAAHPGSGIVVDAEGQVYFMHTTRGIWKIGVDGELSQVDGPGWHWMAYDRSGSFAEQRWPRFLESPRQGVIAQGDAELRSCGTPPTLLCATSFPIAMGTDGALYYAEPSRDERMHIKRLTPGGEPTSLATIPVAMEVGPGYEPWKAYWVHGIAVGNDGTVYYTEKEAVRKVDPDGTVSLVMDAIEIPDCEGHERGGVMLRGIDVADDGILYVVSTACAAIARIARDGSIDFPLLERDESWTATGVAVYEDDVYVLEYWYAEPDKPDTWSPRVRKLSPDGTATVIATLGEVPQ